MPSSTFSSFIFQRWLEMKVFTRILMPSSSNRKLTRLVPRIKPAPPAPSSVHALDTRLAGATWTWNGFQKNSRPILPLAMSMDTTQPSL